MVISQCRFLAKGWVEELYLGPGFHFTFSGFHWVKPLPELAMYAWVFGTIVFALLIALGLCYRWATVLFFLSFTYLELIDKAYYLNHYYFISLVAFLLIFIPAHHAYSLDSWRVGEGMRKVPRWSIDAIRLQLGLVYFFAGIAKIKYDWLILGQPLKIWLAARTDLPAIGPLFEHEYAAYLFSWGGMIYDLCIPFFLSMAKTRKWAYLAVIGFHVTTYAMFYIGMFPWVMIASTLIFFEAKDWYRIFPKLKKQVFKRGYKRGNKFWSIWCLMLYFGVQSFLPIRHFFHPGNVLENEKGLRFAWHVMLMEKSGHVEYTLTDQITKTSWKVLPSTHLTPVQEKQMSFQSDMIIQYGKYLQEEHFNKTARHCTVTAKNWTALNGRPSKLKVFSADQFE